MTQPKPNHPKRLLDAFSTLALVSVITVLVWLFAAQQSVTTLEKETVTIELQAPERDDVFYQLEPEVIQVNLSLEASSVQISDYKALIRDQDNIIKHPINLDLNAPMQIINLDIDGILEKQLQSTGVSISKVEAKEDRIKAVQMRRVRLPITLDASQLQLADLPSVQPSEVEVTLPASEVDKLGSTLTLTLNQDDWYNVIPGLPAERRIDLTLPRHLRNKAQLSVEQVDITAIFKEVENKRTLPAKPILIAGPPYLLEAWSFKLPANQRTLEDIELRGPVDLLDEILAAENDPDREKLAWVVAKLGSTDDIKDGKITAKIEVHVPAEVKYKLPIQEIILEASKREP